MWSKQPSLQRWTNKPNWRLLYPFMEEKSIADTNLNSDRSVNSLQHCFHLILSPIFLWHEKNSLTLGTRHSKEHIIYNLSGTYDLYGNLQECKHRDDPLSTPLTRLWIWQTQQTDVYPHSRLFSTIWTHTTFVYTLTYRCWSKFTVIQHKFMALPPPQIFWVHDLAHNRPCVIQTTYLYVTFCNEFMFGPTASCNLWWLRWGENWAWRRFTFTRSSIRRRPLHTSISYCRHFPLLLSNQMNTNLTWNLADGTA
jgi:hypothetical protein